MNEIKASLILTTFKRTELLDLGLYSISRHIGEISFPLEIIVINDGIEDESENVCKKYSDKLNITYYFSGQRNTPDIKSRVPAWAINIGVKKCTGDIIIISSPEIFHINDALNYIVPPLFSNNKVITSINTLYFDKYNYLLPILQRDRNTQITSSILGKCFKGGIARRMPFLMGMNKTEFMDIGGYAEDMIGYAADDNDFVERLLRNGTTMVYTDAAIVHLYHGNSNDGKPHPENPEWVYNFNIWQDRKIKNIIKVNLDKEWGVL